MSVRTSHTSPPALTTTTCTSLPFTNPAFTTPSLAQRPETRTTTRWARTRHDRQRNEKTLRDREKKQLRKFGTSLRDPVESGRSGPRTGASIAWCRCWFPPAQTSEEFVCSPTLGRWPSLLCNKKKSLAIHCNRSAISWKPLRCAIESAVNPDAVHTTLSAPAARRVTTTSLWPKQAAMKRGVCPALSALLMSARFSRRISVIFRLLLCADINNGVYPVCVAFSTSARCSSSNSTMPGWFRAAAWKRGVQPTSAGARSTSTPLLPSLPTKSLRAVSTCPLFAALHSGFFFRPPPPDRTAARREGRTVQLRVTSVEGPELRQRRHELETSLKPKARLHVHCLELMQVCERLHGAFERHAPKQIQLAQLAEAAEWLQGATEACGHGDVQELQRAVEGGKRFQRARNGFVPGKVDVHQLRTGAQRDGQEDAPVVARRAGHVAELHLLGGGVITAWKV